MAVGQADQAVHVRCLSLFNNWANLIIHKPWRFMSFLRKTNVLTNLSYLLCGFDTFPLFDRYHSTSDMSLTVIEPKSNPKEALV